MLDFKLISKILTISVMATTLVLIMLHFGLGYRFEIGVIVSSIILSFIMIFVSIACERAI